jgi:hypothetical protein
MGQTEAGLVYTDGKMLPPHSARTWTRRRGARERAGREEWARSYNLAAIDELDT